MCQPYRAEVTTCSRWGEVARFVVTFNRKKIHTVICKHTTFKNVINKTPCSHNATDLNFQGFKNFFLFYVFCSALYIKTTFSWTMRSLRLQGLQQHTTIMRIPCKSPKHFLLNLNNTTCCALLIVVVDMSCCSGYVSIYVGDCDKERHTDPKKVHRSDLCAQEIGAHPC